MMFIRIPMSSRPLVRCRVSHRCNAYNMSRRNFTSSSFKRHYNHHHEQHGHHRSQSSSSFANVPLRDCGLEFTSVISHPQEVEGPEGVDSRAAKLSNLRNQMTNEGVYYDVLIVGGGATGAGAALDAAARGYRVACIERGDFSSETSSRSTKLIWAGIKYMGTAVAAVLSTKLVTSPITTLKDFYGEMVLVYNCHRERRYMMQKQKHLCQWIPIAIPFDRWHVSPPPFGHPLYGFFPILAPLVLKFYDALSWFQCPPSYILTPSRIVNVFPQLDSSKLKYCAVFYEAIHNDARTNLAIAMTAAAKGADIVNYVEMVDTISDEGNGKVVGVVAVDRMTGTQIEIRARKIIFCGGPFTDDLRTIESKGATQPLAVRGAHGTHVVLPGYYCPPDMGLLDFNTSDGRFLFLLPWQGHTLVGTTDVKGPAQTLPGPPEQEVNWILKESSKYMKIGHRRQDVMSAWRGWRPLAIDPHAPPDAPVSRDHVISENPTSGIIFIAGGKWTTWREMAEEVIDRALGKERPSPTLDITLFGGEGYSSTLSVELIHKYGISQSTAEHLVRTYGGRAWDVCKLDHAQQHKLLHSDYPYLEAEVRYACREYACTIEDILSRRTRLAFLNKEAALACIPRVAELMAKELRWSHKVKMQQMKTAATYVGDYGGADPLVE